jgi:exosortase A
MAALADTATAFRAGAGTLALVSMTLTALAFWPVPLQLFELWMDGDRPYSHGLLVGPIAMWLSVRACIAARFEPVAPSVSAVALFAGATVLWVIGYSIDVLAVQQLLFPALLVLAVATVTGWRMARRLVFPVGFLYFAIPFWTGLTPVLQAITVAVVGFVLNAFGIPLFVEGNFITIPAGVFEIADGCAGLHFFVVALTLASLIGYQTLDTLRARLLLVAVAVALALLTNWVRVGSLVGIGHLSKMQHYLITHDHYYYGWVLFAVALVPLILAARYLDRVEDHAAEANRESAASSALRLPPWRRADFAVATLFFLLLALPITVIRVSRGAASVGPLDVDLPAGQGDWTGAATPTPAWRPSFAGADGEIQGTYVNGGRSIDAFIAVYLTQSQERELVAERNRLFPRDHAARSQRTVVLGPEATPTQVREQVVETVRGQRRIAWFWYVVGGRVVTQDVAVKLWQAFDSMRGRNSAGIVAVSAECISDCTSERAVLQAFLGAMGPALASTAAENHGRIVD